MNTVLLFTMLTAYVLGIIIMFIVPEGWMPKGNTPERVAHKGLGRKVFVTSGAIVIVIISLISYFVG